MNKIILILLVIIISGCAVSHPKKVEPYQGKEISSILVVPPKNPVMAEKLSVSLENNDKVKMLVDTFIASTSFWKGEKMLDIINRNGKIEAEIAAEYTEHYLGYDLIVKTPSYNAVDVRSNECGPWYFVMFITLGVVPAYCSDMYYYSAELVRNGKVEKVEYSYKKRKVTGWFALLLNRFEGWDTHYDQTISDTNFSHTVLKYAADM